MTDPHDTKDEKRPPQSADDMWAQRRGKNIAILSAIMGLAVLFFVVTILRMS
ncbi:MAG: hypothetical protein P1U88_16935 [Thalassobaculaceae bacterium]|nr:hypothetical protein [Thalassobaculaceae bacterium]